MKFTFFVLLSLNVVFFLWGYYGSGSTHLNSDEAIRRMQDSSIDQIILLGEDTEDWLLAGSTITEVNPNPPNLIYSRDDPQIFDVLSQRMSESIAQNSESFVTDSLESISARQISNQKLDAVNDFEIATELIRQSKIGDSCCPAAVLPAEFKSSGFSVLTDKSTGEPMAPNVEEAADSAGRKDSTQTQNTASRVEPEPVCYKLGPRFSRKDLFSIAAKLKQAGSASSIKSEKVDKETGFMVYYPAAKSFEASKANVKTLKSKGLRDLWLINNGEMRGSISLGIFYTRERAEIMRQAMEAKEIYPRVKPKTSKRTGYFLVFDSVLLVEKLNNRLAESGFKAKEMVTIDPGHCEI